MRFSEEMLRQTEERFAARAAERQETQDKLESLGRGTSWWEIESPERLATRMTSAARNEAARVAPAAVPTPPTALDPLERIIGSNELMPVRFLTLGAARSRAVGRVVIRSSSGQVLGFGTGFLISPRLLMTNHHVLSSASDAAASRIQFDFVETESGGLLPLVEFALEPAAFFVADQALDFALVAVAPRNSAGTLLNGRGFFRLIVASGKALIGERLNILQHPGGDPQQVALRDNTIVDVFDDFIHYTSDTLQGASGSAACSDAWELAALHHSGVVQRNAQGEILLKNGQVWDGSPATEQDIAWIANEGVRISSIATRLQQLGAALPVAQRALLGEALALGAGAPETAVPVTPPVPAPAPAPERPAPLQVSADGQCTWIVPVRISVAVGGAGCPVAPPAAEPPPAPLPAALPFPALPSPPLPPFPPAPGDAVQPALAASLDVLREAASRPYYEPDQDQAARDSYYRDIDPEQAPGALYDSLSALLKRTHAKVFSYSAARTQHLYPWVDLHEGPSLALKSIYSDQSLDPAEIIRQDLETEARHAAALRERISVESLAEHGLEESLQAALEAQMPFNCEHVVPQSWFNQAMPMRSDLHHLFACEIDCNNFRGNIPYFDFPPEHEAVRLHCGRKEGLQFEPKAGKGAVARATLYFLLRYPGVIGDRSNELQRSRIEILLRWHHDEAVSRYEQHRNAEIAKLQGNRNPLIDLPGLADGIDFTRGFGLA